MTGVQTVMDDNPQLNIREKAWGDKMLYRIILDTHNTLDTRLRVFEDQEQFPLILFSSKETENRTPKVKNHFFVTPDSENRLNLREILEVLYQQEIASVMVEGGGRLFNSFLHEKLYDEIILSQAGTLIGGKESVQLFAEGTSVSIPIELKERDIIQFKTGCIIRGFRCLEHWGNGLME
jgi:diaminohydroxyphosphoribosylaminopyrimidine deaminase/5-amino-6-(5-phosphoribosylamino)uracil reductase